MQAVHAAGRGEYNRQGKVLVIAPWMGETCVTEAQWLGQNPDESNRAVSVCWPDGMYTTGMPGQILPAGDSNRSTVQSTVSAFAALDSVVASVLRAQQGGRFPNLKQVTVAGFSSGAQMSLAWCDIATLVTFALFMDERVVVFSFCC